MIVLTKHGCSKTLRFTTWLEIALHLEIRSNPSAEHRNAVKLSWIVDYGKNFTTNSIEAFRMLSKNFNVSGKRSRDNGIAEITVSWLYRGVTISLTFSDDRKTGLFHCLILNAREKVPKTFDDK